MNSETVTIESTRKRFGTFQGVFTPSILTILGVIMYLRLGWVVGQVGLYQALAIIALASAVTFVTGFSIAATATNMTVGGGGAYFMISRSMGVEAGAAIGLPLFMAQTLGVTFYLTGFAESVQVFLPQYPVPLIAAATLVVLALIAYFSASLALKTQMLIFGVILLSLASFFLGAGDPVASTGTALSTPVKGNFWVVFAVFFPAVTGIEAGIAMSGDLKDPSRSLPLGTLAAVVCGFCVYAAIAVCFAWRVPREILNTDMQVMQRMARIPALIYAGIWGATLSSALGALLGAPRTLQAIARDRILPRFLARGDASSGEPRVALVVSFIMAMLALCMGSLNAIASVLSMFFLTSYCALNLIAGLESLIDNPSWRPTFKTPWWLSLCGALGCFSLMFMIDPLRAVIAMGCCLLIYAAMLKRRMRAGWPDIRRSFYLLLARTSIYQLSQLEKTARSWRPNILVLCGAPEARWHLLEVADAMTQGRGFLTAVSVITQKEISRQKQKDLEASLRTYLQGRSIPALVKVPQNESLLLAVKGMLVDYGMGSIHPNTVLLGDTQKPENTQAYAQLLATVHRAGKNVLVIREMKNEVEASRQQPKSRIDVWWGRMSVNAHLMLTLGHMLQNSPAWSGVELRLHSFVDSEKATGDVERDLTAFIQESRFEASLRVHLLPSRDALFATILQESREADLVFLGMRPPEPEETEADYAAYYKNLMHQTEDFPLTVFTLAGEALSFAEILE